MLIPHLYAVSELQMSTDASTLRHSKENFGSSKCETRVNAKRYETSLNAREHATCEENVHENIVALFLLCIYYTCYKSAIFIQLYTTMPTMLHKVNHILNISWDYITVARPRFLQEIPNRTLNLSRLTCRAWIWNVWYPEFWGHAYIYTSRSPRGPDASLCQPCRWLPLWRQSYWSSADTATYASCPIN